MFKTSGRIALAALLAASAAQGAQLQWKQLPATPVLPANNLSDIPNPSTARANLGLGSLATATPGANVLSAIGAAAVGSGGIVLQTGANINPALVQMNSAPNNGPFNVKMSAAGQYGTGYFENYSTADDLGSSPWNTPNYITLRDVYQGTRGTGHGNSSYAGDGNGPVIALSSWSRSGTYLSAVTLNGGLESAASGFECSDLDVNGYLNGAVVGLVAVDACGGTGGAGGTNSTPSFLPGSDLSWNIGQNNGSLVRRWLNGYFGGTVQAATLSLSGNAFVSGGIIEQLPYTSGWAYDTSGITGTLTTGGSQAFATGSGLIAIKNTTNSDVGLFNCSGGTCLLISSTFGTWVAGTSPASGKVAVGYTSSHYTITSNYGSTVSLAVGLWRVGAAN